MSQNRILEDLFLREKPAKILMGLKTNRNAPVYATILAKESDCTYSHTIKILNVFKKLGIVKFDKQGRIKRVVLTDDGWDIAHNVEAMIKKFNQIEESIVKEERKKPTSGKPGKEEKKGAS
jgi:predicted transcriptional regulator